MKKYYQQAVKEISAIDCVLYIAEFGTNSEGLEDSDIDLLIVFDSDCDLVEMKKYIADILKQKLNEVNIVWGDDETYFYYFREKNTLDIEIFHKHSGFYLENRLLGLSIHDSLRQLYARAPEEGVLIPFPGNDLDLGRRVHELLNSRKGLKDFHRSLLSLRSEQVDLRRIANHLIRNIIWCDRGMWINPNTQRLETDRPSSLPSEASLAPLVKIRQLSREEVMQNYAVHLQTLLEYMSKLINSLVCSF